MTSISQGAGTARDWSHLKSLIETHTATVCVIGQGYVGLSVAAAAAEIGMWVQAIDVDPLRIHDLSEGRNVVPGVDENLFDTAYASGRMRFGTDLVVASDADVVVICVPTPVVEHRPDLSFIDSAAKALAEHLSPGTLVILESTTYPGTTDQRLVPMLEESGLRADEDFLVAYSPERIDPGNVKFGMRNTPRVVGGHSPAATELAATFYAELVDEVHAVSSARAAEMAKLLENTFRMVNIALVNELATLCGEQEIDIWEVIDAAASKPFGFMPFYPGPGVGGHCIPLDPTYLAWQSRRDTGRPFRLVEMAQDINSGMPTYVASRVVETLNEHGLSVRGARVLALGVTYKPDVGDVRESAALEVIARLAKKGAQITYHDPFVAQINSHGLDLTCRPLSTDELSSTDIVLLLTPHSTYDIAEIVRTAPLVFDARNAVLSRADGKVVRL
jgi:UDP-N-acetyl-D-glucosamine dehydrogenase